LPLFAQIDQPLMPVETDPMFLPLPIHLLVNFFRESVTNQEEFAGNQGFMMIGHLLTHANIGQSNPQVIGFQH
jgi:hypothetical protein